MIKASVILPCFNKARLLPLSLAGFRNQSESPKDFEIIVVDDGSTDGTARVVRQRTRLNLRYLRKPNAGPSSARNHGIAHALGAIVIFSDPDMIPCPDFIRSHVVHHPPGSRNAVIGGKKDVLAQLPWWMPRWPFVPLATGLHGRFPRRSRIVLSLLLQAFSTRPLIREPQLSREFGSLDRLLLPFSVPEPPPDLQQLAIPWVFLLSGNFSIRSETLQQSGAFDETFRGWGLEDIELGYRLHKHGVQFIYERAALSYHQVHAFSPSRNNAALAVNLQRFIAKHPCREVALHEAYLAGDISLERYDALVRHSQLEPAVAGKPREPI
ncbi:MAG TPA: glycosyltransferase [Planctomycetota bacterium]|nr:glycosyltransferase [Planctomycetota bacterium]